MISGWAPILGRQNLIVFGPFQFPMVELVSQIRLNDLKPGRQVEITRREQTVMTNVQDLALRGPIPCNPDIRQDRIAHRLERLRDQR